MFGFPQKRKLEKRKVTEAPGDDATELFDQVVKLLGKGPRPVSAPLDWVANIESQNHCRIHPAKISFLLVPEFLGMMVIRPPAPSLPIYATSNIKLPL